MTTPVDSAPETKAGETPGSQDARREALEEAKDSARAAWDDAKQAAQSRFDQQKSAAAQGIGDVADALRGAARRGEGEPRPDRPPD